MQTSRRGFLKLLSGLPVLAMLQHALPFSANSESRGAREELIIVDGWVLLLSDLDLLADKQST